ncbi:MAG: patatin-like phospholipase family protein [Rhodobiaceae bacterium]|nr:patatin-like phospholipase family protein [Rhodobiaceae bacterium]
MTKLGSITTDGVSRMERPPHGGRPTIGLALSGGAARGWAHIGVLRALEEAGYTPDVIAGTSIGAVVGGCFAAGKMGALEEFALSLTRRRIFGLLDFDLRGSGLITGNRLADLLDDQIADMCFDHVDTRLAFVATELKTGHEVWLQKGRMADAMRASYALPGIFRPVRVSGRWLIDGALVNPIPVSVCRAMGARVVIAVNLNADIFGRGTVLPHHMADEGDDLLESDQPFVDGKAEKLIRRQMRTNANKGAPGISSVMVDAFNITQDRIARSRLAGDPPDSMVSLRLGKVGLFEFHRAQEAITIGYETTRGMLPQIAETVAALSIVES